MNISWNIEIDVVDKQARHNVYLRDQQEAKIKTQCIKKIFLENELCNIGYTFVDPSVATLML